jgi:hypothetical protein
MTARGGERTLDAVRQYKGGSGPPRTSPALAGSVPTGSGFARYF